MRTSLTLLAAVMALGLCRELPAKEPGKTKSTVIKLDTFYDPNVPTQMTTRRLLDLMKEDKRFKFEKWGGIHLPGGGKSSLMMAIAGGTAPEIGLSWFHTIRTEIKQQFLCPLNEWIIKDYDPKHPMAWDKNHNGIIDDNEARWEGWKKIPQLWRRVAMENGKIYGIPVVNRGYCGIVFRTDLVQNAGLNPNKPPQTWAEFKYWCQKLSSNKKAYPGAYKGQRGVALATAGYMFLPWIQSAGGVPIIQIRKDPKTGKYYEFPMEATNFVVDGVDLSSVEPVWKANFNCRAGMEAAKFFHTISHQKFVKVGKKEEPVDVTDSDISRGYVIFKDKKYEFKQEDVIVGMGRHNSEERGENVYTLLANGEVAMLACGVNDLEELGTRSGVDTDLLSWFPIPAYSEKEGQRVVQTQLHYIVAYEHVARMKKADRDLVWETMTALGDRKTQQHRISEMVLSGKARLSTPDDLKEFGYAEYIEDIPSAIRKNYEQMKTGEIAVYTEPFMGFWLTMDTLLNTHMISRIFSRPDFDYAAALNEITRKANSGTMFDTPKETLDKCRPYARVIVTIIIIFIAVVSFCIIKAQLKNKKSGNANANVHLFWVPYVLILPAVALIALWRYYPLFRGMVMAFQDYRVTGNSTFVGLDNFIVLALDKSFWMSLVRTCYFVFLNMTLAFLAPIILAILLTEIPKFKITFRTLFFLPQMTSGLVIALLWKLMYSPSPEGFFNQVLSIFNIGPQGWLSDPAQAMICCVIPTVWASMGMGCLIYLAALHSIPADLYEAADIDGAGIWSKLKDITIPTILPLIIINFVGSFIGTFQNMGNIFLMTFGGPGEATTVTSLKIWMEAYINLRFSMATSMAWVLGSLLIGFTYIQIRFLSKVEYKKSQCD